MALIVFLRGVNVGGHRTFRPSILARELSHYDVVNVGAAGTFVVRQPGSRAKFRAELLRKLPFEAEVVLCDARDLIRLEMENPFGTESARPHIVRFVSILSKAARVRASIPITLPSSGEWFLRVIASKDRFVFGVYRRHMKTIGYLGQIDKLFGVPATTRNWNTIIAIVRILKGQGKERPLITRQEDASRVAGVIRPTWRAVAPFGLSVDDPSTLSCLTPGNCLSDYTPFLDPKGLQGARIGIPRDFYQDNLTAAQRALVNDAIVLLESRGALGVSESGCGSRSAQ